MAEAVKVAWLLARKTDRSPNKTRRLLEIAASYRNYDYDTVVLFTMG